MEATDWELVPLVKEDVDCAWYDVITVGHINIAIRFWHFTFKAMVCHELLGSDHDTQKAISVKAHLSTSSLWMWCTTRVHAIQPDRHSA